MKHRNVELDEVIEDLIDDVCIKAEEEREKNSITNESDLFCLMGTLRCYNDYLDKAYKLKTVAAIKKLHKKFRNLCR